MKRVFSERAKQSAALPSSAGSGPLLQVPVQAPMGSTSGVGDTSSSPRSHSLSPDGFKQDHGRPLKIPRRADGVDAVTSSMVSSDSTTSQTPSSTMQLDDGNHKDVRQRSPAVLSSATSAAAPAAADAIRSSATAKPSRSADPALSSSSGTSNASMKRQRPSSQPKVPYPVPSDEETDENQQSSFFLKHQNRALASELKALQHQLSLLEDERAYRRKQCRIASQALISLQATWTQMETELQPHQPLPLDQVRDAALYVQQDAPMSTGNGSRVEIVGSLFDALAALATTPPNTCNSGDENGEDDVVDNDDDRGEAILRSSRNVTTELDPVEKQQLDDLSNISWNILQRANTLEEWIRSVLQKMTNTAAADNSDGDQGGGHLSLSSEQRALIREVGILRGQCREYKIQIAELAKARDDTAKSERRVRRSIYRLSTGRVKVEQVLKDMEKTEEDGTLAAEAQMEASQDRGIASSTFHVNANGTSLFDADGASATQCSGMGDSSESQRLQRQLEELERQLGARDTSIEELQSKLTERERRINVLCSNELTDADAAKVQLHQQTQKRLEQVEKELADVKERLKETREHWAKARGDADVALKTLDDLQTKQKKRWAELTGVSDQAESLEDIDIPLSLEPVEQARKIIELDHKLKQALENVRQADAVRQNLKEALAMNSTLQGKLDEIKGKYAALQAGRSNSAKSSSADAANHVSGSSREKLDKAESSSKSEKLHRRMRKEMAALTASKDAAKAKLERAEKERDILTETNARLLKQSVEKDDMNAKSLSTILHLKNLTEQLTQGKISLEQQLKSAGQLALAARLATNAKDRVAEEIVKEKEALENKLKECEGQNQSLKKELAASVSEWSEADAKISSLDTQLSKAKKRSDELVHELEREQKEKRKLQDALDVAVRKAADAAEKLNAIAKRDGGKGGAGNSAFTVDQLNTQVQVLKSRLACPVCHYRDKDCIIMRCRHMFCKHCVEENIANRSRKCPSCGLKFSEKDVDDVWL